ncbi:ribose-5-phosphate isomerase rki1 [Dispira simplex]|nr:ribose-5-phosphate isomerase rki1 [Dispira simplex]
MSSTNQVEAAKEKAAHSAVNTFVTPDVRVLGVGSGSTIVYAIQRLQNIQDKLHPELVCIPTSFQTRILLAEAGFRVGDLNEHPHVDVAIDGADEVDGELNAIKGGGGAHVQEMVVAAAAKVFVVVADHRKDSKYLGEQWKNGVPVEVLPFAYRVVKEKIEHLHPNAVEKTCSLISPGVVLRMAHKKAGPVITDNGNFLLDVDFGIIMKPAAILQLLQSIPGVVGVGLFCNMANCAYFGQADGTVSHR